MRTLSNREQIIFVVCLGVASAYLVLNGAIKPFMNNAKNLDRQILDARKTLEKNRRMIQQAETVNAKEKYYRDILRQTGTDEEAGSMIISGIEKAATAVDLHISELKPKPVKQQDRFNVFAVTLTCTSTLGKFMEFIDALQGKPYYFSVDELDVAKQAGMDAPELRINLTLSKIFILSKKKI
ncbi:MAG: hypothetical protein HQL23_05560 [Candidatus Omnitrophica bacterium]|nr:hypothetical protein [Candidatus Omnitrophota bacterium]